MRGGFLRDLGAFVREGFETVPTLTETTEISEGTALRSSRRLTEILKHRLTEALKYRGPHAEREGYFGPTTYA